MNDPVLWLAIAGLAGVLGVPYLAPLFRRSTSVVLAGKAVGVPSRYRWTEQEVASLKWAAAHLPASITVTEFLSKMYVDDMVGETCVELLTPKESAL
ncbi:hypothetical protein UFOVP1004_7 [uncultured Caudovirales phage]|uniref:Uncharacterized protein n=1 Tax=uncultured Caudovirales phage TaxID=2100421 RepID=A0A6J5Q8Y5_9CAUD|nr:hypothetical protein UFOVP1004_7 [uncultured Caudovirales phage]